MPDFEPGPWNASGSQPLNNCYDYATNNRTVWHPPMAHPMPMPDGFWSIPGRTKGVTPAHAQGAILNGAFVKVLYKYSCEGVATGAKLDALKKTEDNGSCTAPCWKVAFFIRPYNDDTGGDFHFARQDSDGGWSHKQGSGPVMRLDPPPAPSTTPAPEVPDAVKGYTFCGYLCCCPNTQVAALPSPSESEHFGEQGNQGETAMLVIYEGQSGSTLSLTLGDETAVLHTLIDDAATLLDGDWQNGMGEGTVLFGLGLGNINYLVANLSVTALTGNRIRNIPDPTGRLAGLVRTVATKLVGGPLIAVTTPLPITTVLLAAIIIGGQPLLPSGLVYTEQVGAKVAGTGKLPAEGCSWDLQIKVSTATYPDPNNVNCIFHVYKVETELKKICSGVTTSVGETHTTQTGPHCGNPSAVPPKAAPQPGTRSTLKSTKTRPDDSEEVVIELPDGTTVTITTAPNGTPTVDLDYPSGASGSFIVP